MEKAGAFWLRPFRLQKKLFDDRWSDVETIDRDNRLNTGKIRLAYADGDGALFTGEKGQVIVVPEGGKNFVAVFPF